MLVEVTLTEELPQMQKLLSACIAEIQFRGKQCFKVFFIASALKKTNPTLCYKGGLFCGIPK